MSFALSHGFTFRESLEEWRKKNPGRPDDLWRGLAIAYHEILRPRFKRRLEKLDDGWVRPGVYL
jgi:hypothetical protein